MDNNLLNFIQSNSPDGGFLQSVYWRKFQESVGRKTFHLEEKGENENIVALADIIMHKLPIVGEYLYLPKGPVILNPKSETLNPKQIQILKSKIQNHLFDLIDLARENNAGWIRIEPNSKEELDLIKENLPERMKIRKSAVDMQPKEILVMDISESEEKILAQMKQKTRYNIRLAERKGVKAFVSGEGKYIEEFLRLVKITAQRDKIRTHPENYYRKMFEVIPPNILKLYVAEYDGKIITANLVVFFGKIATYLHGASDNIHREVMAPYLLQWRAIEDAKAAGCEKYDFGGVKIKSHPNSLLEKERENSWAGITRFKTGFAPNIEPIRFPGCWDIVLNSKKYFLYRAIQKIKRLGKLGI